jgi:tetratricopeptide (TPR) repeat protein
MPVDVFISYAHATTQTAARRLRDELAKGGLTIFLDERQIPYGDPFPRDIADGLLDSRMVVVLADETYFQRPWCVYEYQLITAAYRAKAEAKDEETEHIVVMLPETGDVAAIIAHLPPPLARVSWPTIERTAAIVDMIHGRLGGITETLASRVESVNDDAVQRLRTGGDIPLAWPGEKLGSPKDAKSAIRKYADLIPESRGEEFIGRGAEIWRVFHHLVICRAFRAHPTCAVQGLGGSGKSQLAAEFVARYGKVFFPGGIIWVNAEGDEQTLVGQFRDILQALAVSIPAPGAHDADPKQQLEILAAALRDHFSAAAYGADLLWVVDGISELPPDQSPDIRHWCPAFGHVSVLATSRRVGLARLDAHVDLGGMATSSAIDFLTRPKVDRRWLQQDEWKDLADWVGGLPLAISILRASLADGFTTVAALQVARRKEPSALLDREMDALRGEIGDARLCGVTEAFDFSYRALEHSAALRHAAHLLARLAPFPLAERILADLIPPALIGQLAKRSWIQAASSAVNGRVERRWAMHRIPASFLRGRPVDPQQEYADLFNWLKRMAHAELDADDGRAVELNLMVIRRNFLEQISALDTAESPALRAAREFAVAAATRCSTDVMAKRGFRFLAAGLANAAGAGDDVAAYLEEIYESGNSASAEGIPHTLQALEGSSRAAALMGRLMQDSSERVRYQAIVHANGLRALDLAMPMLEALLKETNADLLGTYDPYLDSGCPALRTILSTLLNTVHTGTPIGRERAIQLLGGALRVNGKNLQAGGFTSRHLIGGLLHIALEEESESIVAAAISSAAHHFDADAYDILKAKLSEARDGRQRAKVLKAAGKYLEYTRRPPPPKVQVERSDTGGVTFGFQLGKAEALPEGVYDPFIEAAAGDDPECAAVATRAILDTDEGKMAAGNVAHRLLDEQAYSQLEAMAGALAEQAPDFVNAPWWRGQAREALGKVEDALDDYSTVIGQAPDFADAYLHRGRLLCRAQRFGEAAPDLARAGELDPELFIAHHLGAFALYNLDQFRQAEAAASRAIALHSSVAETWFFRSIAKYAAGDDIDALQDIRRAAELDPADSRVTQFKMQLEGYVGAKED